MANGFTYEIRLRDLMSRGFQKAATASSRFYNRLMGDQQKFQASAKALPSSISQLEQRLVRLQNNRDTAFSTQTISAFNHKIRQTERELSKLKNLPPLTLSQRFSNLRTSLGGIIGLTGGLAIGLAAFGAAKGVVRLGADLEQTRISFQTMLQSAERGNALLAEINEFANVTPFANSDLQQGAKMLLNFGIAGEKVIPTLRRIGDVSGGNKEALKGLTLAFAQVSSAGKLQGQDLLQMINAGFNPLQEISRTTGESMASLKDKMSKGGITAQMVEQAFSSVTAQGGRFYNMMERQSRTLGGKWSTLMGKFRAQVAQLGERLTPFLGRIVDIGIAIVDYLPHIPAFFAAIPQTIQQNLDVVIPLGIAVGALGAQFLFAKAAMMATSIAAKAQTFWTGVLTAKQWLLNAALTANPIGLVIALIAGLVAAIIVVKKRTEGWGKSFTAVGVIIKTAAKMYWEHLKFSFNMIWLGIKLLMLRFEQFGQWLKGLFQNIGKAITLALALDFSGAKRALATPIKTAAAGQIEAVEKQQQQAVKQYTQTQIGYTKDIIKAGKSISIKAKKGEAVPSRPVQRGGVVSQSGGSGAISQNGLSVASLSSSSLGTAASTANSIATGGKKQTVLNVHIEKVLENVTQHITQGKEEADKLVDTILDELTRRLHGTFKTVGS